MKRRNFITASTLAGAGVTLSPAAFLHAANSSGPLQADLLIKSARVYTMDGSRPLTESVAILGDRIIATGSNNDLKSLEGPSTRVIDGTDATITPGFIDAHSHPDGADEVSGTDVNLRSVAEIKTAMHAQAAVTPPGQWVIGYKYDDTKLSEGRPVHRRDLDEAVPQQPAIVRHRGGHTAVVNSKGLELAGIKAKTPDPEGGSYGREDGELTGFVAEKAFYEVILKAGEWPEITREVRQQGVARMSRAMVAAGLTSTTDSGGSVESLTAYQDARDAGELLNRLSFMPYGPSDLFPALKSAGIRSGFGDEWIRFGAVKFGADGSASERTMRMSTPFKGRPDDYGLLTMSQEEIDAATEDAVRSGWRIGIHANGDVTIDMVLKAYERALQDWSGPNPRFRIEHCSLVNPDLLQRIKDTGSVPTPFYTYAHYHGNKWVDYGEDKMQWMFAHKSFLDYGIPVAPASDYTPGPFEPLMAIQSMVTRKDFEGRVWGPDQRITVGQAMKICTVNGAYASMEENIKGSITPGKLADLVMLAADPHDIVMDEIKNIPILKTIVGGKTVYEA
ncbi:MAG: amidohydrolase family protein [Gammaproteobacteria bacterium]|jgi:predicted amidohydrolase YtcJ|nr:amidohydrolase family protein [Gammaproteobacteria bacterium]